MSAVQATRPIEFRNASIGTTIAVLHEIRPPLLADALHKMLGGMPDFFNGEATILDFAELDVTTTEQIDWAGLLSLLRRFRMQPIGVRNLQAEHLTASARQAGLAMLDDAEVRERQNMQNELAPQAAPSPVATTAAPVAAPPEPASIQAGTMFVDRPVRSGQQVYARGGDLVLLAGMSNGAEIIADGSIHCYGPLRGRALAGAQGNSAARIMATNFGPEIVSIAGVYKTFEQGIMGDIAGKPALVRLTTDQSGQKLGIEPLQLD